MMHNRAGSPADVILRDGDELIVPRFQQQVTVIGEVQSATSHLYSPDLSRDDYIALSGGTTRRADRSKIYVVHANGSVVAAEGHRWFESAGAESEDQAGRYDRGAARYGAVAVAAVLDSCDDNHLQRGDRRGSSAFALI